MSPYEMDAYTATALKRGRPNVPCACLDCVCKVHAYGDTLSGGVCIWCRNGQHSVNAREVAH